MKNIILDSSVIAKWFFPTEIEASTALKIKEDFLEKRVQIYAPILIYYEISNILKNAVKTYQVKEADAKLTFKSFLSLDLIIYNTKQMLDLSLEKAIKADISAYDAQYIVLAEILNYPLYTSDQKLLLKTKNTLIQELSEYSS